MKIALAQMDVSAGDPAKNIKTMLRLISEAKHNHSDIIAFPEHCVGGYFVGDKWLEEDWIEELLSFNDGLKEAAEDIIVIYGNVAVNQEKRGRDGRIEKSNAVYIIQNGIVSYEAKTLLPNYRIFDDQRYFTPRQSGKRPLFKVKGKKFGLTVCEDMWSNDYDTDPVIELLEEGADFIINISASPWTFGKNSSRDRQIGILGKKAGKLVPFYYVNNVGVQNNGKNLITFDGDSSVYRDGVRHHEYDLEAYEEGIIYIDDAKIETGGNRDLPSEIEQKYKAIIRGIQGFDQLLGDWNPNFIIGLSGGADSSLVAVLMANALGADRVLGYNLPSIYNSDLTKNAAAKLADNLKIHYQVVPIEELVEVNKKLILGTGSEIKPLVDENIQAKIRGTSILSNLAAANNGLMTNNGNKLETALGYATLYGDVNGGLAPIADLTKEEVFRMIRWINREKEIIPKELLPDENYSFIIPPSAELKEDQKDPIKFGYHDFLITHLMDYRKKSPEHILKWYKLGKKEFCEKIGMEEKTYDLYKLDNPEVFINDLEWFVKTSRTNIFKRIQCPPIILLTRTAFGYDLRESQFPWKVTAKYESLKKELLSK